MMLKCKNVISISRKLGFRSLSITKKIYGMMQKILTRKHYVPIQRHLLAFGYFEFIDFL